VALDLAPFDDSFLEGFSHLVPHRDSKYTSEFREILKEHGTGVVLIPPRAPNCNPHAERFVRSLKEECLDRMILFGRGPLERSLRDYGRHYHEERNHQGLGNKLIEFKPNGENSPVVECRERLGGLLRYYYRAAASPQPKFSLQQTPIPLASPRSASDRFGNPIDALLSAVCCSLRRQSRHGHTFCTIRGR
jgi:hypothetical protein